MGLGGYVLSPGDVVLCALYVVFGIVPLVLMIRSLCKHLPVVDVDDGGEQQRVPVVAPEPPPPTAAPALARVAVALPYFSYAARGGGGRSSETTVVCAICLEPLRQGQLCSEVPACRHAFHRDCVRVWARSSNTCPMCRAKIVPGSGGVAVADGMV